MVFFKPLKIEIILQGLLSLLLIYLLLEFSALHFSSIIILRFTSSI